MEDDNEFRLKQMGYRSELVGWVRKALVLTWRKHDPDTVNTIEFLDMAENAHIHPMTDLFQTPAYLLQLRPWR